MFYYWDSCMKSNLWIVMTDGDCHMACQSLSMKMMKKNRCLLDHLAKSAIHANLPTNRTALFNHFRIRSGSTNLDFNFHPLNHRNEGNSRSLPSYETHNIMIISCLMAIINNASSYWIEFRRHCCFLFELQFAYLGSWS